MLQQEVAFGVGFFTAAPSSAACSSAGSHSIGMIAGPDITPAVFMVELVTVVTSSICPDGVGDSVPSSSGSSSGSTAGRPRARAPSQAPSQAPPLAKALARAWAIERLGRRTGRVATASASGPCSRRAWSR